MKSNVQMIMYVKHAAGNDGKKGEKYLLFSERHIP